MDSWFRANAELSKFSRNYMELKKNLPIRPSEMGVLNILAETPVPHTPVLLAELLGVSKSMVTAHLASLSEKGYLTKEPSREDKRSFYILPTEKALELVEHAKQDMFGHLERLIGKLGQDKFDTLVELAAEANDILQSKGD